MPLKPKNIVFFHPDLGIGGAERLIVDAAVGLQNLGHKVVIYTSHCDKSHCFDEVKDGTLKVHVRGNLLPPHIFNKFHILFATLRQLHLLLSISLFSTELLQLQPDIFVVDQLSACIPLLRWLYPGRQRVLFYCHFPDQLLAKGRDAWVKTLYRLPFDAFEEWSTSASDRIVVNSKFTRGVSKEVFRDLGRDREFGVVYPCVSEQGLDQSRVDAKEELWQGKFAILLSINRFERKKDIALAIKAYHGLTSEKRMRIRLVLAGGYDSRFVENVEYHRSLEQLADTLKLKHATVKTGPTMLALPEDVQVVFFLSVPEEYKILLLRSATLLLYTPQNEHFGIVPVEAMKYGLPVLASNTGGPLETIVEGETGYLRDTANPQEWTEVIEKVMAMDEEQEKEISEKARQRVKENFTREIMAQRFEEEIGAMIRDERPEFLDRQAVVVALGTVGVFFAALLALVLRRIFAIDPRATEFVRIDRSTKQTGNEQMAMNIMGG